MKKEAYEFRRDIVTAALNPRNGKIMSEKIVKYYEDKLKTKVSCIILEFKSFLQIFRKI